MRILVYPWHSYNYADITAEFERRDMSVDYIPYHLDNYDSDDDFLELGKKLLAEKDYDFVFSVNYFPVISDLCQENGVRYVAWTCDNPLIAMFHRSVFNDCNIIFTFDMTNLSRFKSLGVKHIYYLPLCSDVRRIDGTLSCARDLYLYRNDISFVGSLYEKSTYDRIFPRLPEYLRGYLEAVIRAQKLIIGGNIIEDMLDEDLMLMLRDHFRLEKSGDSFSSLALIFSTTVLGFKVANEMRTDAMLTLGRDFQTALYTNSRVVELPGVDYRGEADYFLQMPKVFNSSAINLNITIPNIISGIPLRAMDIMASGGFLLTDPRAELSVFFRAGEDYDTFESMEELKEKCAFYLAHEDERRAIAQSAHEKMAAAHDYRIRVSQMLSLIERLPDTDDPLAFMK